MQMAVLLVTQGTLFVENMGWHALRLKRKPTNVAAKTFSFFCFGLYISGPKTH